MTSLSEMVDNNVLELIDGNYNFKDTGFVKETQISSQVDSDTESIVILKRHVTFSINIKHNYSSTWANWNEKLSKCLKKYLQQNEKFTHFPWNSEAKNYSTLLLVAK